MAKEKGLFGSSRISNEYRIIRNTFVNEIVAHFNDVFQEKKCSLLHFPIILGNVKMFFNLLIFINFVLISSGKTKFSMASCVLYTAVCLSRLIRPNQ